MQSRESKGRSVVPKKMQIPLLIIGIPLLLYSGYHFASSMGWVGGDIKAKQPVAKKKTPEAPPAQRPQPTPAPAPLPAVPDNRPALEDITLGERDPLTSGRPKPQEPPEPRPGGGTEGPVPGAPARPGGPTPPNMPPPVLPGPLPAGFPPPTTGPGAPEPTGPAMVAAAPQEDLPEALATPYPQAHRGFRRPAETPLALVGTISGSRGTLAVVHRTDVGASHGAYVRPGEEVGTSGHRVEEIESGKITVKAGGRSQELALPRHGGGTGETVGGPSAGGSQPSSSVDGGRPETMPRL